MGFGVHLVAHLPPKSDLLLIDVADLEVPWVLEWLCQGVVYDRHRWSDALPQSAVDLLDRHVAVLAIRQSMHRIEIINIKKSLLGLSWCVVQSVRSP